MNEERGISMSEFKTVLESLRSDIKKVVEVMNHQFEKMGADIHVMKGDISSLKINGLALKSDVQSLKTDMHTVKEEIALLHEGQTEIKAELRSSLKEKVTYQDFNKLEKRVSRLERKTA
jgi:chromosome segregation ATPase